MIPKIIHQTWKTEQIPSEWQAFADSWKTHHPDWCHILWTNDDGASFVKQYFPEFQNVYFGYPFDIQRADAIRYLVVYHYGGVYADLDIECLQPFDCIRDNERFVIGLEPRQHAKYHLQEELLCNAIFASQPKSEFLRAVIEHLTLDKKLFAYDVVRSTGPIMLQSVYSRVGAQSVDVQPAIRFSPLVVAAPQLQQLAEGSQRSEQLRQELVESGCFAVHYWSHSWVKDAVSALINPHPNDLEGYLFYPRADSPGMDLFKGSRDIKTLAELCSATPSAVAFNTDGLVKHAVCATNDLLQRPEAQLNEGLYIKRALVEAPERPIGSSTQRIAHRVHVAPRPFLLFLDEEHDQMISPYIKANRHWERAETELMRQLISPGETVVDIGAHIGYFTVLCAHLVGDTGMVVGFEPEQNNYALLRANIELNRLKNTVVENCALADRAGDARLYLSASNTGDHRVAFTPDRETQDIVEITLDNYAPLQSKPIHFIKCDTQGYEPKVLQGMQRTIEQNKQHLGCLFEFSAGLLNSVNPKGVEAFIGFLIEHNAEVLWINARKEGELVVMDERALFDLASKMLKISDVDYSYNLLVFFSTTARDARFRELGW